LAPPRNQHLVKRDGRAAGNISDLHDPIFEVEKAVDFVDDRTANLAIAVAALGGRSSQ